MNKPLLTGLASILVVCASANAFADDTAPNPDKLPVPRIAPKHVVVQVGAGPSFSSISAGDVNFISFHAHLSALVGHEVLALPADGLRLSLGVGYAGSF